METRKIKSEFLAKFFMLCFVCFIILFIAYKMYNFPIEVFYIFIIVYAPWIIKKIFDYYKLVKLFKDTSKITDIVYNYEDILIFTRTSIFSIRNRIFKVDYKDIKFINCIIYNPFFNSTKGYRTPDKIIFHTDKKRYVVYCYYNLTKEKVEFIYRVVKEYNPNVQLKSKKKKYR